LVIIFKFESIFIPSIKLKSNIPLKIEPKTEEPGAIDKAKLFPTNFKELTELDKSPRLIFPVNNGD